MPLPPSASTRYAGFLLVVLAIAPVRAQVCTGDITLTSQADVDAFACSEVMGSLTIDGFNTMSDISVLTPLSPLTAVGGSLTIQGNDALPSLDGLGTLAFIGGSLSLFNNDALVSIADLENITAVGGTLGIDGNDALATLAGLENITSVGLVLSIEGNDMLESLAGLEGLTSVGQGLGISNNAALMSIAALENLTSLGQALLIVNNDALGSLEGLENVTAVGLALSIEGNDVLESLAGLEGLTSVGGDLTLSSNAALASLMGLQHLTFVGGALTLDTNFALASLAGLENVTAVGALTIETNTALNDCACGLTGLISGDPPTFTGVASDVVIFSNAAGGQCTSPAVVLAASASCEPVANEPSADVPEALVLKAVYPNPFRAGSGLMQVSIQLAEAADLRVTVYDVLGREVAALADDAYAAGSYEVAWPEAAALPAGTYTLQLEAGAFRQTRRFTVVR